MPGGGSAAAAAGAMAAGLVAKVLRLTIGRERFRDVGPRLEPVLPRAGAHQSRFLELIDEDSRAFEAVMAAYRLPRGTDAERSERAAAVERALVGAAGPPLEVARLAVQVMADARLAAELGNPSAASDARTGYYLARAAYGGARANVAVNLAGLENQAAGDGIQRELATVDAAYQALEQGG